MLQCILAVTHLLKLLNGTVTKYLCPTIHIKYKVEKTLFIGREKRSPPPQWGWVCAPSCRHSELIPVNMAQEVKVVMSSLF